MKIVRSRTGWLSGLLGAVVMIGTADAVSAQQTSMPSTLRYGSGYLDVPSATVIPHLAVLGTFSGFWVNTDAEYEVDSSGRVIGVAPGIDDSYWDGAVALGLFDRAEVGVTLQSFGDDAEGGNMWGAFGRIQLIKPETQGIGISGGARYISGPDYGDPEAERMPPRLGFPDSRFHEDLRDGDDDDETVETDLTLFGVATAYLRGPDDTFLPDHDFTFSVGWGNGMWSDGEKLEWYRYTDSEGFFAGASVAFEVSETSLLHLMGEWNGFDVNLGAQLDLGGFRVGGHVLGANYIEERGVYRSPKWGVLASLALCPGEGLLCAPSLMPREGPDTVRLPAPPPDTVVVEREVAPPLPTGTATDICLATGESVQVLVTAQGDTLVGPDRVSIRTLRPAGVVFAGAYADGRTWFVQDQPITFEQRQYLKSGGEVRLECPQLMRVGEYMGVPLFAMRNAERPYETLYVPVRPGIWQAYQTDLRRTRGQ